MDSSRTALLLGEEAVKRLSSCRVAVFGLGGVGGYTVEALVRAGVGFIDLIDNDQVAASNLNRQLIATSSTVGRDKTDVWEERIKDIDPTVKVVKHKLFYTPDTAGDIDLSVYDYVVDAIDTVSGKLQLAVEADKAGVPLISCMGAGNKLDPTLFEVADIAKTSVCPLARVMRKELKARGILHLKVVYSKEQPRSPQAPKEGAETKGNTGRIAPGSVSFVPSVAGLILAGEVIKDLTGVR